MITVILTKPTQLNGKEYSVIEMDLESLKGKDLIEMEGAFRVLYKGEYIPVPDMDSRYLAIIAGRCSHINPKDLEELDAPDFKSVCTEVRNFLYK